MRLLVFGSGLIGPAAVYIGPKAPQVTRVTLCDRDAEQLAAAGARLAGKSGVEKLHLEQMGLANLGTAARPECETPLPPQQTNSE